ncbi:MAG: hypothetical protein IIB33_01175 [Chloroflexi bacterium]|nr:hypothetical protein [Chloroflexota bacterium]
MNEREAGKVQFEGVLELVNDMHKLLEVGTTGERRALLRSFVQEIVVGQDEAAIRYTLPLAVGSPDEEKVPAIATGGTPGEMIDQTPVFEKEFALDLS